MAKKGNIFGLSFRDQYICNTNEGLKIMEGIETVVAGIERKVHQLIQRIEALNIENNQLKNTIETLNHTNTNEKQTIEQLKLQHKNSNKNALSNQNKTDRIIPEEEKIDELLREIDYCLGILNR